MRWVVAIEYTFSSSRKSLHTDSVDNQPTAEEAIREVAEGLSNQGVGYDITGSRAWAFELGKPICIVSVDHVLEINTREPRD